MQIDVRGGPRRSMGVPGVSFGRESRENRAENLQPDCLQVANAKVLVALILGAIGTLKRAPLFYSLFWVPEGSLAGGCGCHEMTLELVYGADFWCKLMFRASPGDRWGVAGSVFGLKPRKTGPIFLARLFF